MESKKTKIIVWKRKLDNVLIYVNCHILQKLIICSCNLFRSWNAERIPQTLNPRVCQRRLWEVKRWQYNLYWVVLAKPFKLTYWFLCFRNRVLMLTENIWTQKMHAAAAAAKSLQSCPTLCDPIDGSPPGSSIHGIF